MPRKMWWRIPSIALVEDLEWDPVDLVGKATPRGVELLMTSGTVEPRLHQVLGWGAPSRTPGVVGLQGQEQGQT